jgi:putative transcriptional regulator
LIIIKLDRLLKEKGIPQRELARRVGIRHPTINEMCLNKVKSLPLENLDKICIELDCKLSDIIEFQKEDPDC